MISRKAEYTIRKGTQKEVEKAVRVFVRAIHRNEKGKTLLYEAFRIGKTRKYVHVMIFANKKCENAHAQAKHTIKFVGILYPSCLKKPIFTPLEQIK